MFVIEVGHTDVIKSDDFPDSVLMSKLPISGELVCNQHIYNGVNIREV